MTSNQVAAQANQINAQRNAEEARANRAKETETKRANKEKEKLTARGQDTALVGSILGAGSGLAGNLVRTAKNHPSWTNRFPELTNVVGSIPKKVPAGYASDATRYTSQPTEIYNPMVMVYNYVPVLGATDNGAITTVSAQMYTWIRSVNSGSRNYERSDLILYLIGGASIVSLFSYIAKVLALENTFSRTNSVYDKAVLRGLGLTDVGIETDRNNMAIYVTKLNILARRFNSFFIPAVFPVVERWMWMAGFLGKELKDTDICPVYVTKLECAYKFTTEDPSGGTDTSGKLKAVPITGDVGSMLSLLEDLVNSYFSYEDMAIIAGDIHHAFGEDPKNYIHLGQFDLGSYMLSYHSIEDLTEFENAMLAGPIDTKDLWITQNANTHDLLQIGRFGTVPEGTAGILSRVSFSDSQQEDGVLKLDGSQFIFIQEDSTPQKPEDLLKYSSLQFIAEEQLVYKDEKWYRLIKGNRTEIVTTVSIVTMGPNGLVVTNNNVLFDTAGLNTSTDIHAMLITALKTFSYTPCFRVCKTFGKNLRDFLSTSLASKAFYNYYDITNVSDSLNSVALYSLYGMDTFGTSKRFQGKYDVKK